MNADVQIVISEGPLPSADATPATGAGAWVVFEGVVRPEESGRVLTALVYEAYEPMTTRELKHLAGRVAADFGLMAICVEHSVGRVAVGEVSFRLSVASAHRAEALAAVAEFIDAMKRTVPLWKNAEFASG